MLSSLFWYSCFYLHTCSLWMSFGVYITGVLFQSVSFVSFMLIAHGYCVTSERLSVSERRATSSLGKFQGAMHILAVAEIVVFINMDNSMEKYWIRLFIREWARFCIFLYIGWIFRSQDMAPRFSVMPTIKPKGEGIVPPIYSIAPMAFYMMVGQYKKPMIDWWVTKELDATSFKDFSSHEWQIGVVHHASSNSRGAFGWNRGARPVPPEK